MSASRWRRGRAAGWAAQTLRIGSRASPLALKQSALFVAALRRRWRSFAADGAVALRPMRSEGDRRTGWSLAEEGGKGLFVRTLEDALLSGKIDCAVHSLKDMPAQLPPGLALACFLERDDPRDALISAGGFTFEQLAAGSRLATSSLRRAAQARRQRADLRITALRGNVGTRIAKVRAGQAEATIVAAAGLKRLERADEASQFLDLERFTPAAGQGIIAVECRADDESLLALLAALGHQPTAAAAAAERAVLQALGASCRTPVAAHARLENGALTLDAMLAAPSGSPTHRLRRSGAAGDAAALGREAGLALKSAAGEKLLASLL